MAADATAIATGTKMFLVARAATVGPSTRKPTRTCSASISATGHLILARKGV
jgi:hypothetical protein